MTNKSITNVSITWRLSIRHKVQCSPVWVNGQYSPVPSTKFRLCELFCFLKNKPLAAIITYSQRLTVIVLSHTNIVRLLRLVSTIHSNLSSNADPKRVYIYNCFYLTFLLFQLLLFDDASRLLLHIFPELYNIALLLPHTILSLCAYQYCKIL